MTDSKKNQVALVTGARTGIGRFLCEHLLAQGYAVVGCSRKPAEWKAQGFTYVQADVTNEQQVKALLREIAKLHGRLDVAINNAGTASMNHFLLTPLETYQRLLDTNLLGTWLVSQEAAKLMRKRKHGRIVNFGSIAVPLRLAGEAAYVAAKSAVASLSQVMARELADFGITVNVVAPGPVATDLIREFDVRPTVVYTDFSLRDLPVLAAKRTINGLPSTATIDDIEPFAASRLQTIAAEFPNFELQLDDFEGSSYYTGLRFRLYDGTSRTKLAQGGRYDNLYATFGAPAAAVGFTFTIDDLD